MNKIQEFNLQYGLTNVSTNAFANVKKHDQSNDLAGKPKKNILEILKRFVTNPVAITAFLVFVIIIILSIVLPHFSGYSPDETIKHTKTQENSLFYDLPPKGQKIREIVNSTRLQQLNNYGVHYTKILFNSIDLNVVGKTAIEYNP